MCEANPNGECLLDDDSELLPLRCGQLRPWQTGHDGWEDIADQHGEWQGQELASVLGQNLYYLSGRHQA